jgi:hypothetical protein
MATYKTRIELKIYQDSDELKEKVRAFFDNFSHHTIASLTG